MEEENKETVQDIKAAASIIQKVSTTRGLLSVLEVTHKLYHAHIDGRRHTVGYVARLPKGKLYLLVLSCQKQKCKVSGGEDGGEYEGNDRVILPIHEDDIERWLKFGLEPVK